MQPMARWRQMQALLAKVKPSRLRHSLYSDLDLFLLGAIYRR